ncbi:MAG: hypothetical protein AXW14_08895 [Alteromonas sp. Nap_26]|nr:MAG: hypothetical protein AXW14_08895 [Alteromonas sp. Nap_26]
MSQTLDQLKAEADSYGISYSAQIGEAGLQKKIDEFLKAKADATKLDTDATAKAAPKKTKQEVLDEAMKLVRVNIQCMNPAKKDFDGEIITVGNSVIGTVRKFVKFNTDDGFHIPNIIYQVLKARQFNVFYSERTKNGVTQRKAKPAREFSIEVLDPLTQDELDELKKAQAARG